MLSTAQTIYTYEGIILSIIMLAFGIEVIYAEYSLNTYTFYRNILYFNIIFG